MKNPKSETRNPKQIPMNQTPNNKQKHRYDLEERTLTFTQRIIKYVRSLPKTQSNFEIIKQLIRSAGSVGANYIEANEALGRKDFLMKIKISKREAKESRYWLILSEPDTGEKDSYQEKEALIKESVELMKIFGSILEKSN